MRGRRQPPAVRYGHCGVPVDEPKNERQNRTDQESRSDWKIEREVLMLHDDVARQAPQPERADPSPQETNRQDQSEQD
jgi:hypothetical protein